MTDTQIDSMIRYEADKAARQYGPDHFDLRCVLNSRGDTLTDIEVLDKLRAINRAGTFFSSIIRMVPVK